MKTKLESGFHGYPGRQRGVVTLAIGIILLLLITLVTLYGGRSTVLEQRISANDYRQREASGTAQAGLNFGIEYARANQQTMRAGGTNGWFDGTLDLTKDGSVPEYNPEWGPIVNVPDVSDCEEDIPDSDPELRAVCKSGFRGDVRFFGTGFDPQDLSTYDVPLDWPASASGALDDCPGGDCRVHVELVLCEFLAPPPAGQCVDPAAVGSSVSQYAVLVLARGESADGTAKASVRQTLTPFDLLPGNAFPPLMASGNVEVSGTLDIVINPDGAGPGSGIPMSAWANSDLQYTGAARFCYPDEYFQDVGADITALSACNDDLTNQPCVSQVSTASGFCPMAVCDTCNCPTSVDQALTYCDGSVCEEGIDVVDVDGHKGPTPDATNYPDDVFEYVFGVPSSDYETIKYGDNVELVADCSGINSDSRGFYWVEGDCSISGTGGSPDGPLVMVVEGDFRMQGGGQFFGLTYLFADPPDNPGGVARMAGGTRYYGVIVSDHQVDMGNGTYHLVYSECMLEQIRSDDTFRRLGPVPGTWADHM